MKKPNLLLSICCAPCATVAVEELSKNYNTKVLFWGNNIHPEQEYRNRLDAVLKLAPTAIILPYQPFQPTSCEQCFETRLQATCEYADKHGLNYFATSLTTSPHKDATLINNIGTKISKNYIPTDFKKNDGFNRSVALSKQLGLFRQKYCGCQRHCEELATKQSRP